MNDNLKIIVASLGAAVLAAAVLVSVILPAEYGWDPLGTGEALGLLGMSDAGQSPLNTQQQPWRSDRIQFQLSPFEAVEYKYRLEAGTGLVYRWHASGELLFDMHSEPDPISGWSWVGMPKPTVFRS